MVYYEQFIKWSEVWATLLPIIVLLFKKRKQIALKPVIIYICLTFIIYVIADIANIVYFNNNFLYNILSIVRLYFFIWFFATLKIPTDKKWLYIIASIAAVFLIVNFIFFESFKKYSSRTFTLEGIVLITFCILYFLRKLKSDEVNSGFDASLYIVTGLAIYEAVSFPIFLTYTTLAAEDTAFAVNIWYIHNIAYLVFCLLIARAFYGTTKHVSQ